GAARATSSFLWRSRLRRSGVARRETTIEAGGEMFAQVASVGRGAVDETGLASSQKGNSHQVHPRRLDHAAVVPDATLAVEHGQVQPGIVRAITGRPYHGANPAA